MTIFLHRLITVHVEESLLTTSFMEKKDKVDETKCLLVTKAETNLEFKKI
jgi:hypothetical protein